jgi:L-lactate dehydrogenase complex protein LldG
MAVARNSSFHRIIASVRSALEHKPRASASHTAAPHNLPIAPAARRAELFSQFGREIERVSGHFMGLLTMAEATARIATLADELKIGSAALGAGVKLDLEPAARMLAQAGVNVVRAYKNPTGERATLRDRIAAADLGIIEADYAIASTGTFAVLGTPERPNSLTLLPPMNLIIVDADRILPDLAALIDALGPDNIVSHRLALITGPSRTADIEKLIVLGVHGPRQLYAAAVWH